MPVIPILKKLRLEDDRMLQAIKSELTWASQWNPVLKAKSWGYSSVLKCLSCMGKAWVPILKKKQRLYNQMISYRLLLSLFTR